MAKAYSYIRFSTTEQQRGSSLQRQTELSEKYARSHGLELDTSLTLRDLGVSAFDRSNITKGKLGVFLNLVQQGKIERGSYLLVESLDRLSRAQVMDALEVFISILNAEITIVTLLDNTEYSRESTNSNWANLIMSIMIMVRAADESATKSKRGRAAWDIKRANARTKILTARCPYWMRINEDASGFELIPERVEVVKKIIDMTKSGLGNSSIVKRLNEEGIKPFSDKTDGWRESYIQKMMKSCSLYGDYQPQIHRDGQIQPEGEPIENYYPAILSKEEWLLINLRRRERATRGSWNRGRHLSNLFSGLLVCGHCRGPMLMGGHTSRKTGANIKYVYCSRARRGLGCSYTAWGYTELEEQIIKFCQSVDFSEVLGRKSNAGIAAENSIQLALKLADDLATMESKLANLIATLEVGGSQSSTVLKRIVELETEVDRLREEKTQADNQAVEMTIEATEQTHQQTAILETLTQLQSLEGSALHDLRIKLSSQIKRSISKIHLYPCGGWLTSEKRMELRLGLEKTSYPEDEIEEYLKEFSIPDRDKRYLTILFINGDVLRLDKHQVSSNFKTLTHEEYFARMEPS